MRTGRQLVALCRCPDIWDTVLGNHRTLYQFETVFSLGHQGRVHILAVELPFAMVGKELRGVKQAMVTQLKRQLNMPDAVVDFRQCVFDTKGETCERYPTSR